VGRRVKLGRVSLVGRLEKKKEELGRAGWGRGLGFPFFSNPF
jgi:hypothetical protein